MAAPAWRHEQWGQTPVHAAPSGRRWFPLAGTFPAMSDRDALAEVLAGIFCRACSGPSIPGVVRGMFSNRKTPAAEGRSQFCLGECFNRRDGQKPLFLPTGFLSCSSLGREEGSSLQSHSQGCCTPKQGQWAVRGIKNPLQNMVRPGQGILEHFLAAYHQLLLAAPAGPRWLLCRAGVLQLLVWETEGFLG